MLNWKFKALITWLLAVPAFTGFPLNVIPASVLPGIAYAWILYGAVVWTAIVLLLGRKIFKICLVIALAIAVPLIILGSLVSCIALTVTGWHADGSVEIVYHYAALLATMVVVIPLALSMVAVIPFYKLELHILQRTGGVTIIQKIALIFLRVFSHIFYFVIPTILEVIREEGVFPGRRRRGSAAGKSRASLSKRLKKMTQALIHIGVEAICSSIRFIPLWADEISMLPNRQKKNRMDEGSRTRTR